MHDVSIHVKRFTPMPAHCPAARHDPYRCVCTSARARLASAIAAASPTRQRLAAQHLDLEAHLHGLTAQIHTRRRPWWRAPKEGT